MSVSVCVLYVWIFNNEGFQYLCKYKYIIIRNIKIYSFPIWGAVCSLTAVLFFIYSGHSPQSYMWVTNIFSESVAYNFILFCSYDLCWCLFVSFLIWIISSFSFTCLTSLVFTNNKPLASLNFLFFIFCSNFYFSCFRWLSLGLLCVSIFSILSSLLRPLFLDLIPFNLIYFFFKVEEEFTVHLRTEGGPKSGFPCHYSILIYTVN